MLFCGELQSLGPAAVRTTPTSRRLYSVLRAQLIIAASLPVLTLFRA